MTATTETLNAEAPTEETVEAPANPTRAQQLEAYTAKVLETAQPEAFELSYLIPGIVGEVGEMFGQRAKAFWHKKPVEDLLDLLSLEAGDVTWMTALLLDNLDAGPMDARMSISDDFEDSNWVNLLDLASDLNRWWVMEQNEIPVTEDQLKHLAQCLWEVLASNAVRMTGHTFQEVLDKNVAKLASRASRGTLKGNGDKR